MSVYYQLNGFDGLPEIFTQPSYTCVLSLLRKLKSFGSLEITGRRAVDGLFDITFHYFSHCSRRNDVTEGTVPGNLLRITTHFRIAHIIIRPGIASIYRDIIGISAMNRYIGDHLRTSS